MPTGYIRTPIEKSPEQVAIDVFNYIKTYFPNWNPNDGALDVLIIRAYASKIAEILSLASDVQDDIFASFGASVMGIAPIDAQPATGTTTWFFIDALGHTIPAGTYVGIRDANNDLQAFQTIIDITVPNGLNSTAVGAVTIRAVDPGTQGNGLNNVPVLIDVLDFVDHITITGPTSGAVDAETFDDYLDRLVRRLHRLSTRPILAEDYALAALDADPGVYRAIAVDGYDPDTNTYNNPKYVAVSAVDSTGTGVSAPIKANVDAYLQAQREVNFVVKVFDPNYTDIDVAASVAIDPNYTAADVQARVIAAIEVYLDKANWGATDTDPRTWEEKDTLYYNELISLVDRVEGVTRVADLTVNKHGLAPGRVDVALTSPAALTTPHVANITCTVVP